MSVINQMLRDLDKQAPAGSRGQNAGASTKFAAPEQSRPLSGPNMLRSLLLLLLFGGILWSVWPLLSSRFQTSQSGPVPPEPVRFASVQPLSESPAPSEPTPSEPGAPAAGLSAPGSLQPTEVAATEPSDTMSAGTMSANQRPPETLLQTGSAHIEKVEGGATAAHPVLPVAATTTSEKPAVMASALPKTAVAEVQTEAAIVVTNAADGSGSQAFAATPATDLSTMTALSKAPSSMQVEKLVQDPAVLAAEQARVQQLQQLQQVLQLARQASQQQQWQETLRWIQQIPAEFASAESWQLQANARQQLGDFAGALDSWQQLLLLQPQLAQGWLGKALAHDQLAQWPEAKAAYQQAYALPGLSTASRQFIQQRLAQ